MKTAMQESSSSAASHSFLLDDDSAIPFNHADVERMVDDTVGAGMLASRFEPYWKPCGPHRCKGGMCMVWCLCCCCRVCPARPFSPARPPTHTAVPQDLLGETPVPKQLQDQPSFSFLRKPLEMALQAAG